MNREAISRARFFLALAAECSIDRRSEFEAFADAAILFARSAILRIEKEHKSHPEFKSWWCDLLSNSQLEYLRKERNLLTHESPSRLGQVIGGGAKMASAMYFYELDLHGNRIDAIETLSNWIMETEKVVDHASKKFSSGASGQLVSRDVTS
jgi:hypothetical protein